MKITTKIKKLSTMLICLFVTTVPISYSTFKENQKNKVGITVYPYQPLVSGPVVEIINNSAKCHLIKNYG